MGLCACFKLFNPISSQWRSQGEGAHSARKKKKKGTKTRKKERYRKKEKERHKEREGFRMGVLHAVLKFMFHFMKITS